MNNKVKLCAILAIMIFSLIIGSISHELTHVFSNPNSPIREICFMGWNTIGTFAWVYMTKPINIDEYLPAIFFYFAYLLVAAPLIWVILKYENPSHD